MNRFIRNILFESQFDFRVFYHGSTDKELKGKNGIHVGTYLAAKEALESRIGVPVEGEWDGKRKYGETLLCGKKELQRREKEEGILCITGFNCEKDVPEENYYVSQRNKISTYSDNSNISLNCHPIIFRVMMIRQIC